ncbi:hypothetical protein SK128_004939, partial [Halocaridina rubra]
MEDRHTIKSDALYGRVAFRPGQVPALHIKPVMRRDQANYTCRVDFRIDFLIAPSKRTHLTLRVIVPPEVPLLKVRGQRVDGTILGPIQEDTSLVINCDVIGGAPSPTVIWIQKKTMIDSQAESYSPSVTQNRLSILKLTRDFHNAKLTCIASNNNLTVPVQSSVIITMNLRPLITKLDSSPKVLQIGHEYDVSCITAGSRPHPNITWTIGNLASLSPITAVTEHGINISTSSVRIIALQIYHGQKLTCRVINPFYPTYPLEDSILLNVTYPPVTTIELGRGISSVVKEGEDVYFNCNVDANPPIYKVSWYHK